MALDMRPMGRPSKKLEIPSGPHAFGFLSSWRENAGLTQADVASHFDVSDVTIHRWETGKAPVTVQTFVLLAKLYHADEPGFLLFPPTLAQKASTLREISVMVEGMSDEDRKRWIDLGHSLAEKHHPKADLSSAA